MSDANAVYLAYLKEFGNAPDRVQQLIAFGRNQSTPINYGQARAVLNNPPSSSSSASGSKSPTTAKAQSPTPNAKAKSPTPTIEKAKSPTPPKDTISVEKSIKPTVAKRHSKPKVTKIKSADPAPTTSPTPKKKGGDHKKANSEVSKGNKSRKTNKSDEAAKAAARSAALSVASKKRPPKTPDGRTSSSKKAGKGGKGKNKSDRLQNAAGKKRNSKKPTSLASASKTDVFDRKNQTRYVPNPAGELMKTHIRKTTLAITRKKQKAEVNAPWGDFQIKINHRYRMDDGRIGICRFNNRTLFGKSTHNWVGLVIEYGAGEHNGTVFGKSYFRCGAGKGIMVRPIRLIEHLGSGDKKLTKQMKNGGKELLKEVKAERAAEKAAGLSEKPDKKAPKSSVDWVPPKWDDYQEDHGTGMLDQKLRYNKRLLDKNKGKSVAKKKRVAEIGTNAKYQGTEYKEEEDDWLAPRPENKKLASRKNKT